MSNAGLNIVRLGEEVYNVTMSKLKEDLSEITQQLKSITENLSVFAIFRRFSDNYKNNKGATENLLSLFVGAAGLELATACTPCKNASQLHHAPICAAKIGIIFQLQQLFNNSLIFAEINLKAAH